MMKLVVRNMNSTRFFSGAVQAYKPRLAETAVNYSVHLMFYENYSENCFLWKRFFVPVNTTSARSQRVDVRLSANQRFVSWNCVMWLCCYRVYI